MTTTHNSPRLQGNLLAMLSMLLWATSFPITDVLLNTWDPLSLALVRLSGAGLVLALLVMIRMRSCTWQNWPLKDALLTGALGIGIGTALMNFGIRYSNPINVAVIATTVPVVSIIMGVLRGEERITLKVAIAICLSLAGGVLVSASSLQTQAGFEGGELLMITAVILWTWYSRVSVTRLLVIPALPRVMLGMIAGGMALLPIIAIVHWGGLAELSFSSTSTDLLFVTWLCVFAVGAGMVYWMMSAERIGVTVAAIHINVVPFYVLILMLLFGGSLLLAQVAGAMLVATGVVIAQVAGSSKPSQT